MIGNALKRIRTENRWTLDALAEKSGVSRVTIWKIEKGHASPSVDTLQKLADAMGLPIAVFFEKEVNSSLQKAPRKEPA